MRIYSCNECKQRSFARAASVLKGFYDEQAEVYTATRCISVSSRIFDPLIHFEYIYVGASEAATKLVKPSKPYNEHIVPCVYIRDLSFEMFHDSRTEDDVAGMIRNLLKIAHITNEEACRIDAKCKIAGRSHRQSMPKDWSVTDPITRRLDDCDVKIIPWACTPGWENAANTKSLNG